MSYLYLIGNCLAHLAADRDEIDAWFFDPGFFIVALRIETYLIIDKDNELSS